MTTENKEESAVSSIRSGLQELYSFLSSVSFSPYGLQKNTSTSEEKPIETQGNASNSMEEQSEQDESDYGNRSLSRSRSNSIIGLGQVAPEPEIGLVLPDENHPEKLCEVCGLKYNDKRVFESHLRTNHNMEMFEPRRDTPETAEHYCKWCDEDFTTAKEYRYHMVIAHKAYETINGKRINKTPKILHPELTPDIRNPYYYCCVCDFSFLKQSQYTSHLRSFHKMATPKRSTWSSPNLTIRPNINDPNFYCVNCDKPFTKNRYRFHLYSMHDIVAPGSRYINRLSAKNYVINQNRSIKREKKRLQKQAMIKATKKLEARHLARLKKNEARRKRSQQQQVNRDARPKRGRFENLNERENSRVEARNISREPSVKSEQPVVKLETL